MSLGEFDLIGKYFTRDVRRAALGIGDDPRCRQIALGSTVAADRLGHKALAVNLSDLAACGAQPLGFTLALALPRADEAFLEGFARGLFALAEAQGIELVGGDTTQGPLNICITVFGEVPPGQALLRSGARAGDGVSVVHVLGNFWHAAGEGVGGPRT